MVARLERRQADRNHRGYIKPRESELLACNTNGRTPRCEPVFFATSKVTGKWLREQVRAIKADDKDATSVSVDGGFDLFDSFRDYLDGCDYEPSVEVWEFDVPAHLFQSA